LLAQYVVSGFSPDPVRDLHSVHRREMFQLFEPVQYNDDLWRD
jgi:hypothetical protein